MNYETAVAKELRRGQSNAKLAGILVFVISFVLLALIEVPSVVVIIIATSLGIGTYIFTLKGSFNPDNALRDVGPDAAISPSSNAPSEVPVPPSSPVTTPAPARSDATSGNANAVGGGKAKVISYEGQLYFDVTDYGTLSEPPSDEAKTILGTKNVEARRYFEGYLQYRQARIERACGHPDTVVHPDARAAVWGAALAKLSEHYRDTGQDDRAIFFMRAAWRVSRHPLFAYNLAVLSSDAGDFETEKNLLEVYVAQYRTVLKSTTLSLACPELTAEGLETVATAARSRLASIVQNAKGGPPASTE